MKKVGLGCVAILALVVLTAFSHEALERSALPNLSTTPSDAHNLAIKKGKIKPSPGEAKLVPGELFAKPPKSKIKIPGQASMPDKTKIEKPERVASVQQSELLVSFPKSKRTKPAGANRFGLPHIKLVAMPDKSKIKRPKALNYYGSELVGIPGKPPKGRPGQKNSDQIEFIAHPPGVKTIPTKKTSAQGELIAHPPGVKVPPGQKNLIQDEFIVGQPGKVVPPPKKKA